MKNPAKDRVLELVKVDQKKGRLCMAQTPAQTHQLARATDCGVLLRPFRSAYATPEFWQNLSPEQKNLCAARTLGQRHPTWVFAGPTAALVHGMSVGWDCLGDVYLATSRRSHTAGRSGIRRIVVSKDTTVERAGLHVTSFMRTIYDCLRTMSFCNALIVADSALRHAGISQERLMDNIMRLYGTMPQVRRVAEIISHADGRSENGGESFARAQMISLGYASPDLQRVVTDPVDGSSTYRADFAWDLPDGSTIYGELDRHAKYVDAEMTGGRSVETVLLDERRREARLTLSGQPVRVMRFSLSEAKDAAFFDHLLSAYGVPRSISIPEVALG